ncbi:hypothetical protein BX600DRAFT_32653 [Xylariales sp. PMI_506]|nr:hypothetical protein BX600DRAFT_32653 [Xylariales sp. PMI_506]
MMNGQQRRPIGLAKINSQISGVAQDPPEELPQRPPRKLVLCFDGTGNQYKGDGTETNIIKIFGLLRRESKDQCKVSIPISIGHTLCQ